MGTQLSNARRLLPHFENIETETAAGRDFRLVDAIVDSGRAFLLTDEFARRTKRRHFDVSDLVAIGVLDEEVRLALGVLALGMNFDCVALAL